MASTATYCTSCDDLRRHGNTVLKRELTERRSDEVIATYVKLQELGFLGDNYTYPVLLRAASNIPSPTTGLTLHGQVIKTGFSAHPFVQTSLIKMYSTVGNVGSAHRLFEGMSQKDLVAWNSMLDVYTRNGRMDDASDLFDSMPLKDQVSYNTILAGYASLGLVDRAEEIFIGAPARDVISWNSMILAHTKACEIDSALALFERMPERNVVTWNTLLSGLAQAQQYKEAFDLFSEMKSGGYEPNNVTFVTVLSACAHIGLLGSGKDIHVQTMKCGLALNPHVAAALIDMYAKCGDIEGALVVFYKTEDRDIYCWNSMISGLAIHGHCWASIRLFHDMKRKELKPDDITFIGLLNACSHAGFVDEGCHFFKTMEKEYSLMPKLEHYGCMVDLLGRAGHLACAHELIKSMPFEPSTATLGALLSACTIHGDLEVGEAVIDLIVARRDYMSDGEYIMLTNIFAKLGRWEESRRWREMMNSDDSVVKTAAWSTIEIEGRMHKFLAGDS